MKSMKLSKEDLIPQPTNPSPLAYPYGLRITLNEDSLKRLGIKDLPAVGDYMMIKAKVEVCATNKNESKESGEHRCLELQITDMEMSSAKRAFKVDRLYNDKK